MMMKDDALFQLKNLLAVIHRDGGEHTDQVGVTQSVVDAIEVWAALRIKADSPEELCKIHALLDGREWSPTTLDQIADLLRGMGFVIKEPGK